MSIDRIIPPSTYETIGPKAHQATSINELQTILEEFSRYSNSDGVNEITVMTITPTPVIRTTGVPPNITTVTALEYFIFYTVIKK